MAFKPFVHPACNCEGRETHETAIKIAELGQMAYDTINPVAAFNDLCHRQVILAYMTAMTAMLLADGCSLEQIEDEITEGMLAAVSRIRDSYTPPTPANMN